MYFSYRWLQELVGGLKTPPAELMRLITLKTAESEGLEEFGGFFERVCAARVVSVEPIEGSHTVKATVDTERYGVRTVVCGAANCREGVVTAYVPADTLLGDKRIEKAMVHGVESDGMLASAMELGINGDHEGIVELNSVPGAPVLEPDFIIEIDNKSLTHRPDLWGHHGMAREVAAIVGLPLIDPADMSQLQGSSGAAVNVDVADFSLCQRYSALVVENVTVRPSPLWLQARLKSLGMNPINNVVDVTNYVAAELAQPMHAFDRDRLEGDTILVRSARDGERMEALNHETYQLEATNLVIADAGGAIAIAGVMGGLGSSVTNATTRIVLESATFHASSVRKTSSKLKLRTDASMRFEKSQDPANTVRGIARAVELLKLTCPELKIGGLTDVKRMPGALPPIPLKIEWLSRKLGKTLTLDEVAGILTSLEFGVVRVDDSTLSVTVPSWRATKDVSMRDDLLEEVGRMIGYGEIPPAAPLVPSVVPPANPRRVFLNKVRGVATQHGFHEVYNYSFLSNELARKYGFDPADHLQIENPLSEDLNLLRRSLAPRIGENVEENRKHFDTFRLFEIGREVHPSRGELPQELTQLAAACYRRQDDGGDAINEVKLLAEALLPGVVIEPANARVFEHPARCGELHWQGVLIGRIYEFHPRFVAVGRAAVIEINVDQLQEHLPEKKKYEPIRRLPSSTFDLSVVAGPRDLVGHIQRELETGAGSALVDIEFLYDFPLPDGYRSLSYRLTVGSTDHTLSTEELTAIRNSAIERVRAAGYQLRA